MSDESATGSANLWSGLRCPVVHPEQLAELERWAEHLKAQGDTGEARAAGRAILMLVAEVERLRQNGGAPPPAAPPGRSEPRGEDAQPGPELRSRRPRVPRRRAAPPAEPSTEGPPPDELQATADPVAEKRLARKREQTSRRRRGQLRLALAFALVLGVGVGAFSAAARIARPDLESGGPPQDAKIGAQATDRLVFWLSADPATLEETSWRLDGRDVTASTRLAGDRLVYDGTKLRDGAHTLAVKASGPFPGADASHEWRMEIDTTGPRVRIPTTEVEKGQPVRLAGTVEKGAAVAVDGRPVPVRDGRFTLAFRSVPREAVSLVASDEFENETIQRVRLTLAPRRPQQPVRAVHVTADAWATPSLRNGVLRLIEQGRINAVELDLKDEAGIIGFDADVPLGRRIGAVKDIYDLDDAVRLLHGRGARVVGRLVAFRDPIHAAAAWNGGDREQVIQTPDGGPYAGYGGFTNFANRAVRQYNIDVALAAAKAGVDDVLYDYVRRPDGPISSMVFPGIRGTPEAAVVRFLAESRRQLPARVYLGASVFGVAATRPTEVGQDVPKMSRELDYVAPMLYPSHWGPGEYDVAFPNGQPYDIVLRSLRDFLKGTKGTGARVMPWLQDFSLGVTYGPAEVAAQIRAAKNVGIPEWILWDPLVTYTTDGMDRNARKASFPRPATASRPVATTTAGARKPAPTTATGTGRAGPPANELGEIPVIMYHQIRADGGGDYDLTPSEFRAELQLLYRQGYRPIRAVDLVRGKLDVPAGKTPVVLTFDDSTKEQLAYDADGQIKPDTAIGIMLDFARTHPDFKPAGTFYVNREPFAGVAEGPEMLRWLARNGFELGNHTHDHIPFNQKDATGVQQALILGRRIIKQAVPSAQVVTLALPLGVEPAPPRLAVVGRWGGESYRHEGVLFVGAGPSPSPFSKAFEPSGIPRIRTGPWRGEDDYSSGFWLRILKQNPDRRYVSDGDPAKITFPARVAGELAPRFRSKAAQSG